MTIKLTKNEFNKLIYFLGYAQGSMEGEIWGPEMRTDFIALINNLEIQAQAKEDENQKK